MTAAMAYGGIMYFECPTCKRDIEMIAEDALEVHKLVHQECGTVSTIPPIPTCRSSYYQGSNRKGRPTC
jgi:hypothetical protein